MPGISFRIEVEHPGILVCTPPGDKIDLDTTSLRFDIVVAVVDLELFIAGDIEVGRRCAQSRVVGDVGSVNTPGVIGISRTVSVVGRLLSALVSPDILSVHQHPGDQRHQDPGIPGSRKLHDHFLGDVHTYLCSFSIDDRVLRDHSDLFAESSLLHGDTQIDVSTK